MVKLKLLERKYIESTKNIKKKKKITFLRIYHNKEYQDKCEVKNFSRLLKDNGIWIFFLSCYK